MATKANFSRNENYEVGSVDKTYFTVDFINSMASETADLSATGSVAGLELTRATIENNGVPVLAEGPLTDSNTQKTYATRSDCLDTISSTTTIAALQAAIRATNGGGKVTATISSATVTSTKLGILTAAAVS
tara:strand:+ start:1496 stop:1891 length:396 start_codon:yes stop_codon:yes gene_type:complete